MSQDLPAQISCFEQVLAVRLAPHAATSSVARTLRGLYATKAASAVLSQVSTLYPAEVQSVLTPIDIQPRTPDLSPFKLSATHACSNSLGCNAMFHFSNSAHDHDDGPPKGSVGVNRFSLGKELDAEPVEFVQHLQKVLRRSRQTVARPHHNNIEFVPPGILHHLVQRRTACLRPAYAVVDVGLDDVEPPHCRANCRRSSN
jgi:hypothetical protein